MKITLTRFGIEDVEVDPQTIITFPKGIVPFEDCKRYKLFHEEGKLRVLWLQSLDDADLVFSVTDDPAFLKFSYEVMLSDEELELLQLDPSDDIALVVILFRDEYTKGGGINAVTSGPIVINTTKRIGLQKLLKEFDARVAIQGV
jgi:flagellar assembly factor FliW